MPFLRNVTRGRGIPDERLTEVAQHYWHYDGVSPINDQNRALLAALSRRLRAHRHRPAAVLGQPQLGALRRGRRPADARRRRAPGRGAGHQRDHVVLLVPSVPRGSGPGRRAGAGAGRAGQDPALLRPPGFRRGQRRRAADRAGRTAEDERDAARLVFTAHSVPDAMNAISGPAQRALRRAAARDRPAGQRRGARPGAEFDMVWQSRSGPPSVPWLEPDVNDHLRRLAAGGTRAVVVRPTGFVSDHLEVLWDLDNEARDTAAELGLRFARAATAGHPSRVRHRPHRSGARGARRGAGAPHLGRLGVCGLDCPAGCCPAPQRRPAA